MREGGGRAKGKGASTLQQEERGWIQRVEGGMLSPTPAAPVPVTSTFQENAILCVPALNLCLVDDGISICKSCMVPKALARIEFQIKHTDPAAQASVIFLWGGGI